MSVETKPNKLTKGLVLDTFHTDVDNTVATYALNAQLEDQEGNHFHYGSEVGTTFIKNIPDNHVVIGHINMERNETVLFTTDGTNSTIGILSRNDDMSYNYEIKVDDSKQTKKLGFKKNTYIRGVYRLLNGCDKVIYFVDGINKDRRINLNQLDSYKLPTTTTSEITFDNNVSAIIYNISTLTGDIKLIKILAPTNILTQSNLIANLIRVINFQSNLSTFSSLIGDINFVQKVASSLNANASLVSDINFVQKVQASLLTSSSVTGNISIPKLVQASLTGTGTTAADLTVNAPSASLLLDLYPSAAVAYSLRKLRAAYTGSAIRVRRSSDNTEQNIGFTGNELDTTALLAFCGAGNGFVTTWYDQSGNARNATQTTQANQPQIVSSGSLIFENGKVSVSYDGINDSLITSSYNFGNTNYSGFVVSKSGGLNNLGRAIYTIKPITSATNGYLHLIIRNNISNNFRSYYSSNGISLNLLIQTPLNVFPVTQNLISNIVPTSGNITFNLNSIQQDVDLAIGQTLNDTIFVIGNYYTGPNVADNFYHEGTVSELIIYMSNQQSNRTGIETNINTHYAIY